MKAIFTFSGKVQKGAQRGKDLGFPTANIPLDQQIPEGIYASKVKIHNSAKPSATWYLAATFIGSPVQFEENDYKAESFVLDFSENMYGKLVSVQLFKKIRDNQKFENEKALIKQMEKDVEEVRKFFT